MNSAENYRLRQMARIIKLGFLIFHEPCQWTRPKLAKHFQVNKATIQRDIDLLREMGIEILAQGKRGYAIVSGFEIFYRQCSKEGRLKPEKMWIIR